MVGSPDAPQVAAGVRHGHPDHGIHDDKRDEQNDTATDGSDANGKIEASAVV
jgi:hypothetical protein